MDSSREQTVRYVRVRVPSSLPNPVWPIRLWRVGRGRLTVGCEYLDGGRHLELRFVRDDVVISRLVFDTFDALFEAACDRRRRFVQQGWRDV